jgi:hypothetical protein
MISGTHLESLSQKLKLVCHNCLKIKNKDKKVSAPQQLVLYTKPILLSLACVDILEG